jgi:hypothetical protein
MGVNRSIREMVYRRISDMNKRRNRAINKARFYLEVYENKMFWTNWRNTCKTIEKIV